MLLIANGVSGHGPDESNDFLLVHLYLFFIDFGNPGAFAFGPG
jgi:hypothetical protein